MWDLRFLSSSPSRAPRSRSGSQVMLLALTLLILLSPSSQLHTVSAFSPDLLSGLSSLFSVPDGPRDLWRQSPDPSVQLPPGTPWEHWHHLNTENQHKLLTRLGIPFLVDIGDEWGLSSLLFTLVFLPQHTGVCPGQSPHQWLFLVHPDERDRRYGEDRLRELHQYFHLDSIWREISADAQRFRNPSDERSIALEHAIASRTAEEAYGPAVLPVTLFSVVLYKVSLLDLGAEYATTSDTLLEFSEGTTTGAHQAPPRPPSRRRLTLTIDALQSLRRRAEWQRVKQKYQYQEGVHALNAMLLQLEKSSATVFEMATVAYDKAERDRTFLLESLRELREKIIPQRVAQKKHRQRQMAEVRAAEHAAMHRKRHKMVCYQLFRVSQTLGIPQLQQLHPHVLNRTIDQRYKAYFDLLEMHDCHDEIRTMIQKGQPTRENSEAIAAYSIETPQTASPLSSDPQQNDGEEYVARLAANAPPGVHLVNVCEHFEQFKRWRHSTGLPHSVSQSFVLLLTLYAIHHPQNQRFIDGEEQEVVDLVAGILPFDAGDFMAYISQSIRDGTALAAAQTCAPEVALVSRNIMSELWYVLGTIELVFEPEQMVEGKHVDKANEEEDTAVLTMTGSRGGVTSSTRTALGVLHLYQSLWYGSRQAASTLGTLREHGIFVPQNEKVAAHFLQLSYMDTINDMMVQLLSRYARNLDRLLSSSTPNMRGTAASSSAFVIPPFPTQRKNPIPLARLLRYEQFDFSVDGWESVDQPYTNYDMVTEILALENDEDSQDSETENEVSSRDGTPSEEKQLDGLQLLKSTIWLSGWHGITRDTQQAECLLLSLLRRRGFVCDLEQSRYGIRLPRDWSSVCPAYSRALTSGATPLPCAWRASGLRKKNLHQFWPQSITEGGYNSVQQALLALSYVYMMDQRFDAAAFYAMLSIEFSFSAYKTAVSLVQTPSSSTARAGGAGAKNEDEDRFSAQHHWLVHRLFPRKTTSPQRSASKHPSDKASRVKPSSPTVPSYVSSGFATLRPLSLLGLNGMLGALSDSGEVSAEGGRVQHMIRETLRHTFGVVRTAGGSFSSVQHDEPSLLPPPNLMELFMVLLAGAANEDAEGKMAFFDRQQHSVHRIDAFVGLLWLIREVQRFSASQSVSATGWASSPSVLWDFGPNYKNLFSSSSRFQAFMPHASDSWLRYACRLGGFASRFHDEASESLLNQLNIPCRAASALHRPRHNLQSDSKPSSSSQIDRLPYQSPLRRLRGSQYYQSNAASASPLWYAADLNMYLAKSGYTTSGRWWDSLINAFYYLFTDTTTESALKKFSYHIMPERDSRVVEGSGAEEDLNDSKKPNALTSRKLFLDAFARSQEVRHFTVALFLVTRALTLGGSPQGFSLIFYTAEPNVAGGPPNPFLVPFCRYLARGVWDPHTTLSMWREEHYVAQWQMEKPDFTRFLPHRVFSLDHHTPFPFALQELRQELAAALNRWSARALHRELVAGDAALTAAQQARVQAQIKQQLLLCSGYLNYLKDLEEGLDFINAAAASNDDDDGEELDVPLPYAGSFLPASDVGCLEDLLLEKLVKLSRAERERFTAYLHAVAKQKQRFYGLSDAVRDTTDGILPPSGSQFCDAPRTILKEASADSSASKETSTSAEQRRHAYLLVEPWRRSSDDPWASLTIGDGVFFNQRLHRVTGAVWASNVMWLRNKIFRWLGR